MGKELIVKCNSIINMRSQKKYTTNELKLINYLIAKISKNEQLFEKKSISISELEFINIKSNNHNQIKKACKNIMTKAFEIDESNIILWFDTLDYDCGVITYKFNSYLSKYLLGFTEESQYTKYNLNNIKKLSSTYSIQTYELLKQVEKLKFRKIRLDSFRDILNIPASYKMNNISKILEVASIELAKYTDISFNVKHLKLGKKVVWLNFNINPKSINNIDMTVVDKKEPLIYKKGTNLKDIMKKLRA